MRTIHTLVLHHSGSDHDTVAGIRHFHTAPPPEGRGWDDIAYTRLYDPVARTWHEGRPYDQVPASNGYGHNSGTISVCVLGDFSERGLPMTALPEFLAGIRRIGLALLHEGQVLRNVIPHRQCVETECPGQLVELLDVIRGELRRVGCPVK